MSNLQFIVPCLFGLEGIAGDELRRLNMENVITSEAPNYSRHE